MRITRWIILTISSWQGATSIYCHHLYWRLCWFYLYLTSLYCVSLRWKPVLILRADTFDLSAQWICLVCCVEIDWTFLHRESAKLPILFNLYGSCLQSTWSDKSRWKLSIIIIASCLRPSWIVKSSPAMHVLQKHQNS